MRWLEIQQAKTTHRLTELLTMKHMKEKKVMLQGEQAENVQENKLMYREVSGKKRAKRGSPVSGGGPHYRRRRKLRNIFPSTCIIGLGAGTAGQAREDLHRTLSSQPTERSSE